MNIYQKLIEVRKSVPYLQKAEKGFQFNYVSSSQVLGNLKAKMDELGLLLIPSITSKEVSEHLTAKGAKEYFTELLMEFTWINADEPSEQIKCNWYGQGLDSGEKGVGKSLTYSEKYFMLKFFNIPTDKDDPDSFQKKHEDTPTKPIPLRQVKPEEHHGIKNPYETQELPANLEGFWTAAIAIGYTKPQVLAQAGVISVDKWTQKKLAELYKDLKTKSLTEKVGN